jgi:hypothetical protein
MRGLLPSVWLLGAALYTALTLFLSRPVIEEWPLPPHVNETVVAKQPPRSARLIFPDEMKAELAAKAPAPEPQAPWRNEWVQIAGFTTVGRLHPSSTSPALFAYSVGRPLRVLAREDGFARVQDLGSGQLGWVRESSLAPFTGGYRQREERAAEPVVAAAPPEAAVAKPDIAAVAVAPESAGAVSPVAVKAVTPVAVKKAPNPRAAAAAKPPGKDTVAAAEPAPRGLFRRKRNQVQHIALGSGGTGVAAIMQRAFGRF